MNIGEKQTVNGEEAVVIRTDSGNIHVEENERSTKVIYYDHVEMTITGEVKNSPCVTIDSDEFYTNLVIKDTENSFYIQDWSDKNEQ